MRDETGYEGPVELIPAYIFSDAKLRYSNFLGIVPSEFPFSPLPEHAWEHLFLKWIDFKVIESMLHSTPFMFHIGILRLFENSRDQIRSLMSRTRQMHPDLRYQTKKD
jgi:hypothetical protein